MNVCLEMGLAPFPPLSLRELIRGTENFRQMSWDHTSELIAAMATIAGGSAVHPHQVHPYRQYKREVDPPDPGADAENMIRQEIRKHGQDVPFWAKSSPADLDDQGLQNRPGQDASGPGSQREARDHQGATIHPDPGPSVHPTPEGPE